MRTSVAAPPTTPSCGRSSAPPRQWPERRPEMTSPIQETTFSRADFLKAGGALIVAIGLPAAAWPTTAGAASGVAQSWPVEVDPSKLDSWLAIHADGTITAFTGKMENHQGNRTALAQIVAEELDVNVAQITML